MFTCCSCQTWDKHQTSCSFPLPPHLSSGRHPDHHQPAAQVPAAVRASSEEVHPQRHVLLPQAQQDGLHLDTTGLLLFHLEFRRSSGQKPIPLEELVKTRERGAVWQVMDSECCTFLLSAEERMYREDGSECSFPNIMCGEKKPWRDFKASDEQQSHYGQILVLYTLIVLTHISLRGWAFLTSKLWQPETQKNIRMFAWDCKYIMPYFVIFVKLWMSVCLRLYMVYVMDVDQWRSCSNYLNVTDQREKKYGLE